MSIGPIDPFEMTVKELISFATQVYVNICMPLYKCSENHSVANFDN